MHHGRPGRLMCSCASQKSDQDFKNNKKTFFCNFILKNGRQLMKFSRNLIFRIFPLVKKGFIHSVLGLSTSSACGAADGLLKLGLLWLELVECFSSTPDFLIVSAGFRSGEFPDQSETLTISSSYLIVLGTVRRWNRQPVPIPADDPAPLSTGRQGCG